MTQAGSFPFDLTSFRKIWNSDFLESDLAEIEDLIRESPLLNETLLFRDSSLAVIDLKRMIYTCSFGDAEKVCGWHKEVLLKEGVGFFLSKLPVADYLGLEEMTKQISQYIVMLSDIESQKFQALFDFRMARPDGSIHRIIQEGIALKRDAQGNILFLLALITDITNLKREGWQHLRMTNGTENLFYQIDNATGICQRLESMSNRELEIARLMGQKLSSEEIADKLFLSLHTVNKHRQNMLRKFDMADTLELINFLTVYRLI